MYNTHLCSWCLPPSPRASEPLWENSEAVHVPRSHQFLWHLVPTAFTSRWVWSPAPPGLSSPQVMEPSDWCCPWPLSAAMSQQIFLHKSLYLSSCASGVKTTTKNCGCRWVSVVYFRLARRGGVLHGCSPVECCRYFSVSAFSFFQHLQCVIFRCTMNGGEGFWNTFGCQWLFTRCWCLSSSIHTSLSRSLGCGRTWRAWMRASESFWLISLFSLDFSVQCESSLPSYGAKPIMRPSPGTDGFKFMFTISLYIAESKHKVFAL